ncbi:hypothetical protein DERP_015156 [Dermatophagoides pteronyssinus]|uniref:Transmembrane protein n=1 Tax=Dermatophagoides pteronyssinus TaxID=6956 RepID=A0ABQ8JUI9_DERPT|nr:hypothetical protein DERP_015156 [Dermatophagoides pteronyssinus]
MNSQNSQNNNNNENRIAAYLQSKHQIHMKIISFQFSYYCHYQSEIKYLRINKGTMAKSNIFIEIYRKIFSQRKSILILISITLTVYGHNITFILLLLCKIYKITNL